MIRLGCFPCGPDRQQPINHDLAHYPILRRLTPSLREPTMICQEAICCEVLAFLSCW